MRYVTTRLTRFLLSPLASSLSIVASSPARRPATQPAHTVTYRRGGNLLLTPFLPQRLWNGIYIPARAIYHGPRVLQNQPEISIIYVDSGSCASRTTVLLFAFALLSSLCVCMRDSQRGCEKKLFYRFGMSFEIDRWVKQKTFSFSLSFSLTTPILASTLFFFSFISRTNIQIVMADTRQIVGQCRPLSITETYRNPQSYSTKPLCNVTYHYCVTYLFIVLNNKVRRRISRARGGLWKKACRIFF